MRGHPNDPATPWVDPPDDHQGTPEVRCPHCGIWIEADSWREVRFWLRMHVEAGSRRGDNRYPELEGRAA